MFLLFLCLFAVDAYAVAAADFTCGPGYVLVDHKKIDGIDAAECQKLWCVDLETGKPMGRGNSANSGYKTTAAAQMLTVGDKSVMCWGERKWCSGQIPGEWDPKHGMYVRGTYNADSAYESFQKSGCFTWRPTEHNCPSGQTAFVNENGAWDCREPKTSEEQFRGSVIRRTSAPRRIIK